MVGVSPALPANSEPVIAVAWFSNKNMLEKFTRLASSYDLRVTSAGNFLDPQIETVSQQIGAIKTSYGYNGLSPLNDAPAPPNPETLRQLTQLEQHKYDLELQRFLGWVETVLSNPEDNLTQLPDVTRKMGSLIGELGQFTPEQVRQNFGRLYPDFLENAGKFVNLLGVNSPQAKGVIKVLEAHLDVTDEYQELRQRLGKILAPAILGTIESSPSTTMAESEVVVYQSTNLHTPQALT